MERLMTMVPADSIDPTHLSAKFFQNLTGSPVSVNDLSYAEFVAHIEQMERDYLLANLAKGGTVRESAKHWMKAPYTTIYGRIKKLNLINSLNGGGTMKKQYSKQIATILSILATVGTVHAESGMEQS
jgi:DNA-binding NtrC family response regulator